LTTIAPRKETNLIRKNSQFMRYVFDRLLHTN
jgi:hypothetical protein